jgi:hypothetical protein
VSKVKVKVKINKNIIKTIKGSEEKNANDQKKQ